MGNDQVVGRHVADGASRRRDREHLARVASGPEAPRARAGQAPQRASTGKQPGRRYGPPPKDPPHPRMQSPAPMSADRRAEVYGRRWTARQQRQFNRQHDIAGPTDGKLRVTPKQVKVRQGVA